MPKTAQRHHPNSILTRPSRDIALLTCAGLTALEVWCLAMIGIVFCSLLAYVVILVLAISTYTSWKLELALFLSVLSATVAFVCAYCFIYF